MSNLTVCIINGIPVRGSICVPPLETGTAGLREGGRESDWVELDRMETEGEAGTASGVPLTSKSIMASSDSLVGVKRGWTALSGLWGDASWGEGARGDANGTTGDSSRLCRPYHRVEWYTVMAGGAGRVGMVGSIPFSKRQTVGAGGASLYADTIHALSTAVAPAAVRHSVGRVG